MPFIASGNAPEGHAPPGPGTFVKANEDGSGQAKADKTELTSRKVAQMRRGSEKNRRTWTPLRLRPLTRSRRSEIVVPRSWFELPVWNIIFCKGPFPPSGPTVIPLVVTNELLLHAVLQFTLNINGMALDDYFGISKGGPAHQEKQ